MTPDPSIEAAIQRVREQIGNTQVEHGHGTIDKSGWDDELEGWLSVLDESVDNTDEAVIGWLACLAACCVLGIAAHTTHHPIRNAKGSE